MLMQTANFRAPQRAFVLACAMVGALAVSSAAFAGECPAEKMKPNAREKVDYKPVGVTDVTLGSIDPRQAARAYRWPSTAVPQANHRARRHRALAQP